ncbi:unnamed protein product [Ambrosiozyma monospora]|uniref:Unnamed protein product n=1 Tax=Ambrosiozyma monospora TaxID=43982 RepID=A0A9W6Z0I8_AMBMO|nr:unnamed protein product [Ambrosiozyma monospora]
MYASSLLFALIPLASAYITGDVATVTETDCTTSVSEALSAVESSQAPVPTLPLESVSTAVESEVVASGKAAATTVPALSTAPAAVSGAVTAKKIIKDL